MRAVWEGCCDSRGSRIESRQIDCQLTNSLPRLSSVSFLGFPRRPCRGVREPRNEGSSSFQAARSPTSAAVALPMAGPSDMSTAGLRQEASIPCQQRPALGVGLQERIQRGQPAQHRVKGSHSDTRAEMRFIHGGDMGSTIERAFFQHPTDAVWGNCAWPKKACAC